MATQRKTTGTTRPRAARIDGRAILVAIGELKAEIGSVRDELHQEIVSVRDDLRREMYQGHGELRADMLAGFADLRSETRQGFDEVRADVEDLQRDVSLIKIAVTEHSRELREIKVVLARKVDREEIA